MKTLNLATPRIRHVDEQSIFLQALDKSSGAKRVAWLDEVCGADTPLRDRIDVLLHKHEQASRFLERPPVELEATIVPQSCGDNLAASLDAGLTPAFGDDAAVVVGNVNHSVLRTLGRTLEDVPHISLRESAAEGADPIQRPSSPEIPNQLSSSRYRLDGEIARGGMGAIIKGRDTDLGRDLAIKVLLDSHKDKPDVIQRFVEEAQIGGQLQHPGIAPVYELGQFADQRPFFSMKLVKGETLSNLLADREEPTAERGKFLGIFEQVCQTMAYAHSRGVIHRDLKPANIMVGAFGEVQVMDWGLAKVLTAGGVADEKKAQSQHKDVSVIQTRRSVGSETQGSFGSSGSETQMGSVMGTPAYMPPEQALGEIDNMDERADVFGLGAILSEILTGKPPYIGDDGNQVFRMASRGKLNDCFKRLDTCEADQDLIALAKYCLELELIDRPRNAKVLAEQVTGYLESVEAKLRATEIERSSQAARADAEAAQAEAERQRAESEGQRLEQQQHSARRLRKMIVGLAAVATIAIGTSIVAGRFWQAASVAKVDAQQSETLARKNAESARKSEATAQEEAARADEQKRIAQIAEKEATEQRNEAVAVQQALRKESYLAEMHLAQQAFNEGTIDRVHELLKKHIPVSDATDLRDIEWYQLWGASHLESKRTRSVSGPFGHMAASPDQKWVAVRRWMFDIDLFDAERMKLVRTLTTEANAPYGQAVEFSADGRWLAAIATTGSRGVQVWRTDDWTKAAVLPHDSRLSAIAFSQDGTLATVDVNAKITFWNGQTWKRDGAPIDCRFGVSSLAFSPDGTLLVAGINSASGGGGKTAYVWDVRDRSLKTSLVGRQLNVNSVAWSTENVIATGSSDESVRLWDGESFECLDTLNTGGSVRLVAFSDDGKRVLATTFGDNAVYVWETSSSRLLRTIKGHSRKVEAAVFMNGDTEIWSSSGDYMVKAWDWTQCEPFARTASGPAGVRVSDPEIEPNSVLSYDGKFLVDLTRDDTKAPVLRLWNATTPEPTLLKQHNLPVEVPWPVNAMAVSQDGSTVVWTGDRRGKQLALHDTTSGSTKTWTAKILDPVADLALSVDGNLMALRTEWHTQVWDVVRENPILKHSFSGFGPVTHMLFSPDGTLLAAALWRNDVRVYDPVAGTELFILRGHAGSVNCLDFSDDGRLLVSGGEDGTVRVWDVEGQFLRMTLPAHSGSVRSVAFAHDDLSITSVGYDLDTRVWRIPTRAEVDDDPDFQELLFHRYQSAGLWQEAVELLTRMLEQKPADALFLRRRARMQACLERIPEAIADYQRACELVALAEKTELLKFLEPLMSWQPLTTPARPKSGWRYTFKPPADDWRDSEFDDSNWRIGGPHFTSGEALEDWPSEQVWMRKEIDLLNDHGDRPSFLVFANDDVVIHVNGVRAASASWINLDQYQLVPCSDKAASTLKPGRNVVTVHCRNTKLEGDVHVLLGTRSSGDAFTEFALKMLEAETNDPESRKHADVYVMLKRWDAAAESYAEALAEIPNEHKYSSERSILLQKLCLKEELFDALQRRLPEANDLWLGRARSLALMSRWEDAEVAYAQYDQQPAVGDVVWFELACSKLLVGDTDGYRKLLEQFREQAGDTPKPYVAFVLSRTHSMAPQGTDLANKAVEWAEFALQRVQPAYYVHTLALANLRSGRTDEAIQTLKQQLDSNTWSPPQNRIALALAYRYAGDKQQAQRWIKEARYWQAEKKTAVDGAVNVNVVDWLPFHVMLQEADQK